MCECLNIPLFAATHSIVGATLGFSLVVKGFEGVQWGKMLFIVGSWFVSPCLAGAVSASLFCAVRYFIIDRDDPIEPGLTALPVIYGVTCAINILVVTWDGSALLQLDRIPIWGAIVISIVVGLVTLVIVRAWVVPWQRNRIQKSAAPAKTEESNNSLPAADGNGTTDRAIAESPKPNGSLNGGVATPSTIALLSPEAGGGSPVQPSVMELDERGEKQCICAASDDPTKSCVCQLSVTSSPDEEIIDDRHRPRFDSVSGLLTRLTHRSKKQRRADLPPAPADHPATKQLFGFVQVLTAAFASFAHGGNDVRYDT